MESFITTDAANPRLDLGAYHAYGTGSGDALNGLVDPNLFAHPGLVTDAEAGDNRLGKLTMVDSRTVQGLTSDRRFTLYPDVTTPAPIIRNEELILLRAEARLGTGDVVGAAADINFIRVNSGGLAARNDLNADNLLDEILKQRRYSLMFEGGHRWIDLRRLNRLEQLPLDLPTHHRQSAFPIPVQEADARGL